jgi:hypothetical protein
MTINNKNIEKSEAISENEEVLLVRTEWNKIVWDGVKAEILERISKGEIPVLETHLQQLGLFEVVEFLATE